jgi:hypothetical protein
MIIIEERADRPLFLPSARQLNWLLVIGFISFGEALYIRYLAVENAPLSLACQAGLQAAICPVRAASIALYSHSAFGALALVTALLNLFRPSLVLLSFGVALIAFGLVLHNTALAGLAAGLLMLSLARYAPAEA